MGDGAARVIWRRQHPLVLLLPGEPGELGAPTCHSGLLASSALVVLNLAGWRAACSRPMTGILLSQGPFCGQAASSTSE
jgi:hypothetical protein